MFERAGTTHYYLFQHPTTGLTNLSFTKLLYKNGSRVTSIDIEVTDIEGDANNYMATWTDDGTDKASWAIHIEEGGTDHVQNYYLEDQTERLNLSYIKQIVDRILQNVDRIFRGGN